MWAAGEGTEFLHGPPGLTPGTAGATPALHRPAECEVTGLLVTIRLNDAIVTMTTLFMPTFQVAGFMPTLQAAGGQAPEGGRPGF